MGGVSQKWGGPLHSSKGGSWGGWVWRGGNNSYTSGKMLEDTSKFVEKHIYFKRGGGRVRWLQMVEIGV